MKGKDAGLEADALSTLAASHGLLGNWVEANRFYKRAQRQFERLGQTGGVAAALCYQAIYCGSYGPLAPAFEMANQALALDRAREDRRAIGRDLRTLGTLHAGVGDTERALACFDEALGGDRQIGYRQGLAYDLAYTAPALIETGRAAEALARLEEALELARASHLRYLYGEALVGLAQAHLESGGPGAVDQASARAEEAGQLGADMGLVGLEVTALALLARATLEAGDARAAHALSERAVGFLRGGPLPTVRAWEIWWHHARILAALNRAEEAMAARDQARTLLEARAAELGDPALAESFRARLKVNRRILGQQS
jgi:tetratricopeptide (TPR) repeat protein